MGPPRHLDSVAPAVFPRARYLLSNVRPEIGNLKPPDVWYPLWRVLRRLVNAIARRLVS
jgi:hypothetical protein